MTTEIRSKYQRKTLEEITFELDEINCPYCKRQFMADFRYFKYAELDGDYDFAKIFCPYCGKSHLEHV